MRYEVLNEMVTSFSEFKTFLSDSGVSNAQLVLELDRLYKEWKEEDDFYFFLEEESEADMENLKAATDEIEFFKLLLGKGSRGVSLLAGRKEKRRSEELEKKRREAEEREKRERERAKSGRTKTITLPGGATMEMIYCAPGSFMMGSPEDEEGRVDDEFLHQVTLTKGFWLGKYPVTQEQWESVMDYNPSEDECDDCPVDSVSWEDCKEFIKEINSAKGLDARFPTEAEWEYACRAGTEGAYSGTGDLDDMGWYDENSDDETHPVGEKEPNAWGFHDMHGNVYEWCGDWYGSYPHGVVTDPKGPSSGDYRVLRGGCWSYSAGDCRSASRGCNTPGSGNGDCGFRLCCSAGSHE
jgi:formylglycine-generating enzyme required for sulfatase activity